MYVVVGYDADGYPIWEDDGSEAGSDTEGETSGNLISLGGPEDIIGQSIGSFTMGSDVIYRLADGSGMGINTETGEYYPINASQMTVMSSGSGSPSADFMSNLRGAGVSLGAGSGFNRFLNQLKSTFTKDGNVDWAALATAAAALYSKFGGGSDVKTGGYNVPVPKMTATREAVDIQDPNRRPGQGGLRYFTDVQYTPRGDEAALTAAKDASAAQAAGLRAAYTPTAAPPPTSPYAGMFKMPWEKTSAPAPAPAPAAQDASNVATVLKPEDRMPVDTDKSLPAQPKRGAATMADGGIAMLARGGRYLQGATDGMADKIPSSIDGKQPAALSHGEFVIPADVVSHLGNGNSDAGAKKLYDMMARVRKARTGTKKQGKKINPDKFMPGGLAGYAGGGVVAFQAGGAAGTGGTSGAASGVTSYGTSSASTLSPWAGEYVTNLLGEAEALSKQPYQAYKGPLTAGASNLQQQAFAGASEMAKTGYTPGTFTSGTFDTSAAQKYMNPYLSAALDPTLAEMRRQSDIARLADASRLTQAGAFGGSRQAIMEAEGRRNLLEKQRQAIGEGYASAYDKAMAQFNAEQGRQMEAQKAGEASRQFSADFGAKSIADLAKLGAEQRAIEQEGLTAERKAFEEERAYPFSMLDYRRKMIEGLPIGATTTTPNTTGLGEITSLIADLRTLYSSLSKLGQAPGP
jgi:hypothetical protein